MLYQLSYLANLEGPVGQLATRSLANLAAFPATPQRDAAEGSEDRDEEHMLASKCCPVKRRRRPT